ncbi:hypothetical protein PF008_g30422 [Phytophthora fragariae]|uniref:RxLR effector protein n=1 Tax=Phytophthora fragariae TaxID=53985 RepID=A0A6G0Q5P2_9STRA|nr:hypothetical protein PF008_g30422 [Phytophthora fragariae]
MLLKIIGVAISLSTITTCAARAHHLLACECRGGVECLGAGSRPSRTDTRTTDGPRTTPSPPPQAKCQGW